MLKEYDTSVLYPPSKTNAMDDYLNRLSLKSVAYVEDDKKELVREVNQLARLGIRLVDSDEGSV